MKTFIIIPAYNEETTLRRVLDGLKNAQLDAALVVVNDGSTDRTGEIARHAGVMVLTHMFNRGLGGALGTGIQYALNQNADAIVTFDADGQHRPEDIPVLLEPLESGDYDVVIGSRFIERQDMPFIRRLYNGVGNIITFLLFGKKVTDSQSGLRSFSSYAASLLSLRSNRMEVSSEIIREISRNQLRYLEVPIKAVYTKYSMSKGQGFSEGIKTLIKLIVIRISK